MKNIHHGLLSALLLLFITLGTLTSAFAQITPSQDSYTNTATATTNYGTAATLGLVSSSTSIQTTYIKFNGASDPHVSFDALIRRKHVTASRMRHRAIVCFQERRPLSIDVTERGRQFIVAQEISQLVPEAVKISEVHEQGFLDSTRVFCLQSVQLIAWRLT